MEKSRVVIVPVLKIKSVFLGGNFFFKKYRVFPALTKSDYGKMNQCSDGITVQKIIVRMCRKKSRNDKNKEVLINT